MELRSFITPRHFDRAVLTKAFLKNLDTFYIMHNLAHLAGKSEKFGFKGNVCLNIEFEMCSQFISINLSRNIFFLNKLGTAAASYL